MDFNLMTAVSAIWPKVWPILTAILFFGVIIFIHELGHFLTAKLFGVKVNEFALGMGPTILKKQGKETKYALRLFPIGGFCAMEGESEESDDERAYCNKKLWQRMIIIVAGAAMNILLGIILCIALVGTDELVGTNTVARFYDGAVSNAEGGLMVEDKIIKIDGKRVYSDYDISFLMQRNESGIYDFVVERNGERVGLDGVHFDRRTSGNFSYDKDCVISSLSAKIKKQGLEDGNRIIGVNGKAISSQKELIEAIRADEDFVIDYKVIRNQGEVEVKAVKMNVATVLDFAILGEEKTVFNVIGGGFRYAASMSRIVYISLFDLLRGHYGFSDMAGPIGTISVISDVTVDETTSSINWGSMLMMMALVTINVGLFNLLPVPALDGGHFFFMLVELVFRKPVPPKYENWIHAAGMVLLLALMVVISASDIWKLISGRGFY